MLIMQTVFINEPELASIEYIRIALSEPVIPPESKGRVSRTFSARSMRRFRMKTGRYTVAQIIRSSGRPMAGWRYPSCAASMGLAMRRFTNGGRSGGMDASLISQMKAIDRNRPIRTAIQAAAA